MKAQPQLVATLKEFQAKIDAREVRERGLLLLTALAVIYLLWNFMWQAPIDKQRANLDKQLLALAAEQKKIETNIASFTLAAANSPSVQKKREIENLTLDINKTEATLATMSEGLISASQLPEALEVIFQRLGRLQVTNIQTLAAEELRLGVAVAPVAEKIKAEKAKSKNSEIEKNTAFESTGVFKHAVVIKLQGDYFELINVLNELEHLSWKFYWESLDYRVKLYPQAEIELRVYTLSSEEGNLGV